MNDFTPYVPREVTGEPLKEPLPVFTDSFPMTCHLLALGHKLVSAQYQPHTGKTVFEFKPSAHADRCHYQERRAYATLVQKQAKAIALGEAK